MKTQEIRWPLGFKIRNLFKTRVPTSNSNGGRCLKAIQTSHRERMDALERQADLEIKQIEAAQLRRLSFFALCLCAFAAQPPFIQQVFAIGKEVITT